MFCVGHFWGQTKHFYVRFRNNFESYCIVLLIEKLEIMWEDPNHKKQAIQLNCLPHCWKVATIIRSGSDKWHLWAHGLLKWASIKMFDFYPGTEIKSLSISDWKFTQHLPCYLRESACSPFLDYGSSSGWAGLTGIWHVSVPLGLQLLPVIVCGCV